MKRILLYGATGFSGRLIAAEARRRMDEGRYRGTGVVLGARDRSALIDVAEELELPYMAFALDDRTTVEAALADFDVVLNAAGPFAHTGLALAKCAIATGCHYVDLNGEVDVYQQLDDLGRLALQREVAMVSGAGFTATVSDVMLDRALTVLQNSGWKADELGAVRIAVSRMSDFSRGSLLTGLRSVREEVITVRFGQYVHVPVGKLERTFDFGPRPHSAQRDEGESPLRIASAANVVDTLTAFHTATRHTKKKVAAIDSFVEMPRAVRLAYQFGALSAVWFQLPAVQQVARFQLSQLPEGPDEEERQRTNETVIVQIDSAFGEPLADWRLETPNSYDVTARCSLSVAEAAADDLVKPGWNTPAQAVTPLQAINALTQPTMSVDTEAFGHCEFEGRPLLV
jgi:short subunit dehydrogenase-like uncharacterized protein